jgi:acyl-CoA synthetase (AMP-forming)/AMP-acid ligase II
MPARTTQQGSPLEDGMNQAILLARAAQTFPDQPAVTDGSRGRIAYSELAARCSRLAGGLREKLGLEPGDRVALAMKNAPAYFEILYGLWWAGIAAVPVNAKLHRSEFAFILENSGARAVFVTPDLSETIAPLRAEIDTLDHVIEAGSADQRQLMAGDGIAPADSGPEDLAWLFYTSGTTGRPKGAMLTNRNLMAMVANYFADVDQIAPDDCMVHGAPLSHGSGLYALAHVAKAANNVIPDSGGFEPAETLAMLADFPGASFFFAPTMVTRLINAPEARSADTGNLKTIVYGGGPMYVEDTLKALDTLGPKLVQIYGQGESPMTITGLSKAAHTERDHPRFLERLGSAGTARLGVAVRVVDDDDRDLPVGETGEIICQGDVVMPGYWQNPEASTDTMRGGWLHTGDVGAYDADGFLTLKDRSKDMIISGGTNIYPREVEEVLLRHDRVAECSVVGRPHPDWGEEVVAFIVAGVDGSVAAEELDRLCLDNIARFKRPKDYRFVASLPKNNYGKVLKTELRGLLAAERD